MMYMWTPDMIRFMNDASENSSYFQDLAAVIIREVGQTQNACDAGCGLGQLAVELAGHCRKVTGVDINKNATDFMAKVVEEKQINNIEVINADVTDFEPEQKFDLMVFNYFGDINQILKAREKYCCGKTVIIKRSYKSHRFSFENKPITSFNRESAVDVLKQKNIAFRELEFSHEFGQPFRSLDDALLFFETYSRDSDRSLINRENVLARLTETEDKNFPYYMKHIKESSILIL